jgi:glutamyl-tRNA synthetase
MARNSAFFYQEIDAYDEKDAAKHLKPAIIKPMSEVKDGLQALSIWSAPAIHDVVTATAEANGLKLGKIAQPLRVAVAGRAQSPPIDVTLALTGRDRVLKRIGSVLDYISEKETGAA